MTEYENCNAIISYRFYFNFFIHTACVLAEHESALLRFMKIPRRKEEKTRSEASEELFTLRKKFHQVSLILNFIEFT